MAELQEYKCPHCGGAIHFDSGIQKMKCPYCDSEFEMDALKALDEELAAEKPDDINWAQTGKEENDVTTASISEAGNEDSSSDASLVSYVCDSCGGEIICDATTAATKCPFCGNPVVMMGQFKGSKKPDLVIPFKLDKEAAKQNLKAHLKGKTLIPKLFSKEDHIEEIKGIYVPFWLFDTEADASCRYNATRERMWSDAHFNYVETNYYKVIRTGQIKFDNVPVDGSSKMPDDLMESIEPYDMSEAVDFQTAYLAGYMADKYDVLSEDCVNRANTRIKQSTEDAFMSTVTGYNNVTTASSSIKTLNGQVRYALLPVWLLNTSWNNQNYTFAMNGQTGKFVGDLPLDQGLYRRYFAGIAVIAMVIFFLLINLFSFSTQGSFDPTWILAAVVFGLLASWAITSGMKNQLKSVQSQRAASQYIENSSMKLADKNDLFLYRRVASTPRARASGINIGRISGSGGISRTGGTRGFIRTGGMGGPGDIRSFRGGGMRRGGSSHTPGGGHANGRGRGRF